MNNDPLTRQEKLNKYGCRPTEDVCMKHQRPLIDFGFCEESPNVKEFIATAVQKAREEVCENHLHELDDALQDTDTYGAISGMAYALRKIITTPTTPEHD